jgi:hypothetical protein
MPEYIEIRVKGQLDPHWSEWFAGLELTCLKGDIGDITLLAGTLPDQAALHGLLERIRDLNLKLISVTCGAPYSQAAEEEDKSWTGSS